MRHLTPCLTVLVVLLANSSLLAQLPQARLKSIYPPAGQVGTSFELRLTSGDDLEEMDALHFTHPGITAKQRMQEVNGQPQPVDNLFDVTIAADVPPGVYEVHAAGLFGVTNPRRFAVSHRQVIQETEGNNSREQAQTVELNSSIIGKAEGGTDIDVFRFTAEQGQRVVLDCLAAQLDSQLMPTLIVRDAGGWPPPRLPALFFR